MQSDLAVERARRSHRIPLTLSAIGVLAFGIAMLPALREMDRHGATVLQFELAWTPHRAAQIVTDWGHAGRSAARTQLILDYGFLVSYGSFLALACRALAERAGLRSRRRFAAVGVGLSVGALTAAGLDASQNAALWLETAGHFGQPAPLIAAVSACLIFPLTAAAILFIVVALIAVR